MADKNYKIKQVLNEPRIIVYIQLSTAKDVYNDTLLTIDVQKTALSLKINY